MYIQLKWDKAHLVNHFYATLAKRRISSPCREQQSLANEREGVVQSKPLQHYQIYPFDDSVSITCLYPCVHFL